MREKKEKKNRKKARSKPPKQAAPRKVVLGWCHVASRLLGRALGHEPTVVTVKSLKAVALEDTRSKERQAT